MAVRQSLTFDLDESGIEHGENQFTLRLQSGELEVRANLTPQQLQTLVLQGLHQMPDIAPQLPVADEEDAFRLPMQFLKLYDDRAIQTLLREIDSEDMLNLLWYMQDDAFTVRFTDNLSRRAAEMCVEDLALITHNRPPFAQCPAVYLRKGREAAQRVLALVNRLIETGTLEDLRA